jgi:hypothetical protein
LNFTTKSRFVSRWPLAAVSFFTISIAAYAHIENADLFDFGSEYAFQQDEGNEPPVPANSGWVEFPKNNRDQPAGSDEAGVLSKSAGAFGTNTARDTRLRFWVRISDWVVSRFGTDGRCRWTRGFRTENRWNGGTESFSLDSFNGVYLTSIVEGELEGPGLAVRSSGSGVESVVFLGHPSRLMSGSIPDMLAEQDSFATFIVARNAWEDEFAAHFALVVGNGSR